MLYALDLFSGIGGNSLGLKDYVRTVAYCEADRHAQAVLLSRMADGLLPTVPICTDVTRLDGRDFKGFVDIIIAGFPCTDISVAGKGEGLEGKRSGLFFEVVRLANEIKPTFLFLENVPAIRTRGLDRVIEELTEAGYDCRWCMLSAAAVGAPHKRERWFCLAHSNDERLEGRNEGILSERLTERPLRSSSTSTTGYDPSAWWKTEPILDRVANGIPQRVDRTKRIGNAVVPLQAKTAFEILMGIQKI